MASFRFIGDWAQHGSTTFTTLGQAFEADERDAQRLALDGVAIIPESDFLFTADECKAYPNASAQTEAPAEFHNKMTAALKALAHFRTKELANE